jgi:amino acid transporter
MPMTQSESTAQPALRREMGKWDLTAIGVNQVIGGAVFLVPATVAMHLGSWSWVAVGFVALLSMAIALNFAEAGSRFEGTGGPYLFTHAAFGGILSFEVGWMAWVTRVTSWASLLNGLADALGFYWPEIRGGLPKVMLMTFATLVIMGINLRGIKQSSAVVNLLTIAKLTPLAIFIILGLPHISIDRLTPVDSLSLAQISAAALVLIFAFGGYEVVPVPAGEAKDPKSAVPFAMIATIAIAGTVMLLAQVVAAGTLPGLATTKTPLADAALIFIGAWGALLMTAGGTISIAGNNMGAGISGSRSLFALAEQGDVPAVFGHINRKYRTPDVAIVFTCLVTLGVALSGSFATLVPVSAIARLLVYSGTCASVLALRRKGPAPFTIPGGATIPLVALVICVAILFGATFVQLRAGAIALLAGAVLYLIAKRGR